MLKLDLAPTNTDKEIDRFEAPRTHVLTTQASFWPHRNGLDQRVALGSGDGNEMGGRDKGRSDEGSSGGERRSG